MKSHILQTQAKPRAALQTALWLIQSVSEHFPPTALPRRNAQTVRDRSLSYRIDYFIVIKNFLNPQGHQNTVSGTKVMAFLLKGWVLPIGGASAGEDLRLQHAQQAFFIIQPHCFVYLWHLTYHFRILKRCGMETFIYYRKDFEFQCKRVSLLKVKQICDLQRKNKKNPAYGRQIISRLMWIVAPMP